jgi:Tol biopolymer transport system component
MRRYLSLITIVILVAIASADLSVATQQQQRYSYTVSGPLPQPQIFGEGVISTGDYDTHPAFAPDGKTLYFLKCTADIKTCAICVSHFKNNRWTEPVVAPFSGQYWDVDPFVTKDGKTLYFSSNRPLKEGGPAKVDTDIWKVEVTSHGWKAPLRLDSPINSEGGEYYPTLADNGTIYFGSTREGGKGGSDIYRCPLVDGQYTAVENLGDSINTADNEFEPFIAPDESYLIFMATIPQGLANGDLYFSNNINGKWSKAEKLPAPLNSTGTEWSPKVTREGQYFFFSSTRNTQIGIPSKSETVEQLTRRLRRAGNGLADIYQVDFSVVKTIMNKSSVSPKD